MHHDPDRDPSFISQSEGRTAQDCGTRWLGEWHHGVRSSEPESPAQIVGSLGHVVLEERLRAKYEEREPGIVSAITAEAGRRGYDVEADGSEASRAIVAADTLLASPKFNPGHPLMAAVGVPFIEHRIRATWGDLEARASLPIADLIPIFAGYRLGTEGQPDFGHVRNAVTFLDDFKFRQNADLGGAQDQSSLVDSQGAFYKVLAKATGALHTNEVIFRQINVYAGEWLTLEDFLQDDSPFVTSHGIPSRDLKVLGMVAADVWDAAWRALVERRLSRSMHEMPAKGKPKPRHASEAEVRDAAGFVQTLRTLPLVEVSEFRLDHSVCVEVVRDMLSAVAGHIALLKTGARPGRHLRTYHTSPCVRRYGCPLQTACTSALGTFRLDEQLAEMAEDGRLTRAMKHARAATVADHDQPPRAA